MNECGLYQLISERLIDEEALQNNENLIYSFKDAFTQSSKFSFLSKQK